MDTSTKIALRESIEHWRRMASGSAVYGEAPTAKYCALCRMFNKSYGDNCHGCPIALAGHTGCYGTPYCKARYAQLNHGMHSPEFKAAALKELEFLESLLPKEDHATLPST